MTVVVLWVSLIALVCAFFALKEILPFDDPRPVSFRAVVLIEPGWD